MKLLANIANRWAIFDGSLTFDCQQTAQVKCGDVEVTAEYSGGLCTILPADCKRLMPDLGAYEFNVIAGDSEFPLMVERVNSRYTTKNTILEYGRLNNDEFDRDMFTDDAFASAILQSEEAIDNGCGRSFCRRKIDVVLTDPVLNELPVVDAADIECEDETVHLMSFCQASGVENPVKATVLYGSRLNAQIANAATKLAASFLRPRATPENARGTAQDGVYISYELPTGEEGSWTGLPSVDAAIAANRVNRVMI